MGKYKKKPIIVEAFELKRYGNIPEWVEEAAKLGKIIQVNVGPNDGIELSVQTLEGTMIAREGDYIIRGIEGEIYPCKREIFKKTYEEVIE